MKCFVLHIFILMCCCCQAQTLDIEGHRGCRGIMPENTIEGFIKALDVGVTTLEMDVVITKDRKVVLSHEPFLNHEICTGPRGEIINTSNETSFNLYQMNYADVKLCDCGSKINPRFKDQYKLKTSKPILESVIDTVEKYITYKKLKPVNYNIEIKSTPQTDCIFHPKPAEYTDMVYLVIQQMHITAKVILQSFDVRVLQYIHLKKLPVKTALLVENTKSFSENIKVLGFNPFIYSPDMALVNEELLNACHKNNILLIPWTVNEIKDISRMLKLGVDGIISDYPDKIIEALKNK